MKNEYNDKRLLSTRLNRGFIFLLLVLILPGFHGASTALASGSDAHTKGKFGALHAWPIIPIAMMLMPDGRVFSYGTNLKGIQNAKLHYSIWDPSKGTGTDAFEVLPNTTDTDIFCAAQAHIPATGGALIAGGDAVINSIRNYANDNVNIFDPSTDTLTRQTHSMAYKRWYGTAVTMPNGEHVVLGGRDSKSFAGTPTIPPTENTYSSVPEVRGADGSWRTLNTAISENAYGSLASSWNYPRGWLNPQGDLFIFGHNGHMFKLNVADTGSITKYKKTYLGSRPNMPSIMYAPGRILSVRKNRVALMVDINGIGDPVVSSAGNLSEDRQFSNATVLADGRVWVNGGSSTGNDLTGAVLDSELWDPVNNNWTATASAATARLYHSTSLLLPDGTVITGGGGAPGPLKQLNGEVYYPPYLFKADGSGDFAPRPGILDAPIHMIGWDQEFSIEATENITRVTLTRFGAATHAFNNEARFFELPISAVSNIVTVHTPSSPNLAPPGYYMLFVWNNTGVPSIARIIHIG
ncbi:MAG: DUF1929 domain-containing protein [Nitrosomonas sp.]|nr:MAG: DUF1929 domain-containing protein [Nitrosomonas sp.]